MKRTVFNTTLSFLALLLVFSCTNKNGKEITITPVKSTRSSEIKKIQIRKINNIDDRTIGFSAYKNKSTNQKSIGEVIDRDFGELAPVNNYSNIVSNTKKSKPGIVTFKKPAFKKTAWRLSITFDNDIFDNTDYYYTNGITIDLSIPSLRLSPINKLFPAPKNPDVEFCGFSLTQNMYTPTDPDTKDILYGDRPFSAYLTLGQFREVYDLSRNLYIKSQINLGVLGPSSLGGQVQSSIHEITPVGWENQINNEFVIDYAIAVKKGLISSSVFDLNVNGNANIGTLYDKIGGGFDLRFGSFMPFYQGPISVFEHPDSDNRLQCWFFFKSAVQFVAFDATLQGGLFNSDNIYTIDQSQVKRLVYQASGGFALYHNNLGIEFENFFISPEFKGGRSFGWGRIKAVLAF